MTAETTPFRPAIATRAFLAATNEFDVEVALRCFRPDAVSDDPSTGETFDGIEGVRDSVTRIFVGYRTRSRVIAVGRLAGGRARLRVDFTGDFGHEIGRPSVAQRTTAFRPSMTLQQPAPNDRSGPCPDLGVSRSDYRSTPMAPCARELLRVPLIKV